MPKVVCDLILGYSANEEAEKVHRSVELDNMGYIRTRVEGSTITARIEADSLNSLLHTLDDFLVCAGVAEKIVAGKG